MDHTLTRSETKGKTNVAIRTIMEFAHSKKVVVLMQGFVKPSASQYFQPLLRSLIRPECYRIRWNYAKVTASTPFKVIQGHPCWYQSKAHMRLPISD